MTQELLKELFSYDKDTGLFTWLVDRGRNKTKGKVISTISNHGYVQTSFNDKKIRMHRMAWIYVFGYIPDGYVIDHINRNRADNRIENLRLVASEENSKNCNKAKNNKSGYTGIFWDNTKNSYIVTVGKKYIGRCKNIEDAITLREHSIDYKYTINHGKDI